MVQPSVVVVAGAAVNAAAAAASAIAVYVQGQQHPDLPASLRAASAIFGKPKTNVPFFQTPLEGARVLFYQLFNTSRSDAKVKGKHHLANKLCSCRNIWYVLSGSSVDLLVGAVF